MFNIGGGELIVIMLIALIVLGPQRLPDAARQVGKTMGELRRLSTGFQNEMKSALDVVDDPTRVAARRNVLAKELPAETPDDAELSSPVGDQAATPVVSAVAAVSGRVPARTTTGGAGKVGPRPEPIAPTRASKATKAAPRTSKAARSNATKSPKPASKATKSATKATKSVTKAIKSATKATKRATKVASRTPTAAAGRAVTKKAAGAVPTAARRRTTP